MTLLLTINLLIVSSLAILDLDLEGVLPDEASAILERVFSEELLDIINNDPPANLIEGKFIAFFDNDCIADNDTNSIDIIQDFLDLFECYTLNEDVSDLYPDTVSNWIYLDQDLDCNPLSQALDDVLSINYDDYCLIELIPDQEFEISETTECVSRTVGSSLWNLDESSPQITNGYQYIEYDPSYNPNMDIIIMDTGVAFSHTQFDGITTLRLFDAFPGDDPYKYGDHGTHCAGTTIGNTYGAFRAQNTQIKLIDVRVFPSRGGTSSTAILNGYDSIITYLRRNPGKKAVINMSFGGPNYSQYDVRLKAIREEGGISVVAAGNSNTDARDASPSSSIDTITVGALNQNPVNERASFSNYDPDRSSSSSGRGGSVLGRGKKGGKKGKKRKKNDDVDTRLYVDIWAPGVGILSAVNGPNDDENGLKSGTSMASPLVAGIAANILASNPDYDFDTIKDTLLNNAINDVYDGKGRTGLPRVQSTCTQYGVSSDINADMPNDEIIDDGKYNFEGYNFEGYNYNPEINYKPNGASIGITKHMVEGFVIILSAILICFMIIYCSQNGGNEGHKRRDLYKVVDYKC